VPKKRKSSTEKPQDLLPMLASLVDAPPDGDDWVFEIKWDGYRAIAYVDNGVVELRSRNNKSFNEKFYPIHQELSSLKMDAILDGEIVVITETGAADFGALQTWRSEADGQLLYYVFDLLWYDGRSLMDVPLEERRQQLEKILPKSGSILLSTQIDEPGSEIFEEVKALGLEGIIAKQKESPYVPDSRSKEWLKIKTEKRQEAVVGGYTKNENTSRMFSALLLGIYEDGQFHFITPVGTGFSVKTQKEILERLKPLIIKECPFVTVPEYNKPSRFRPNPPKAEVTWVRPELVVEISYREMTNDGAIRQPSYKGIREDKSPKEVVREIPTPIESKGRDEGSSIPTGGQGEAHSKHTKRSGRARQVETNPSDTGADTANVVNGATAHQTTKLEKRLATKTPDKHRKTLFNPKDEMQVRPIDGKNLKFTNLSKLYWPDEKISKRDMLNYYYQVADVMLPHMKDRPQTLNRHPHGIKGEAFYQKDVTGKVPEWIDTFPYFSESDNRLKKFLVCTDEASLLYIASLGCIEMNPWHSRKNSPDNPDWCIIDLDPDKNTFNQVIEAACVTKKILDALKVEAFCKTSGSTGLHIYIPFVGKYSYEDSKEFGRSLVKLVHNEIPSYTSIERLTSNRNGKMYLDFLQNRPQATVAAAYSLRPKPGATVSMPLHWDEVKKGLTIAKFHIGNAVQRIRSEGDLFAGVLGKGIDLPAVLKSMNSIFGPPA
jgi:bifunctional non-homologous end joining protein LigD